MEKFSIAWYQANPEYVKAQNEIFDKKYPAHWKRPGDEEYWRTKFLAHKIRAKKLNRMPAWVNEAELEKVFRDCPPNLEIDHIFPLVGEKVSGLNTASNIQYLTQSENCRKNNDFKPRYFKRNYAAITLTDDCENQI